MQQIIDHIDNRALRLMLFDLRGRHRRRAVRVIYTGLALLIGVGLVGFGVGGGFGGGGLLNAASNNEGSSARELLRPDQEVREAHRRQQPNNVAAWEKLTERAAARSRRRSLRDVNGALTEQGQGTVRRRSRSPGTATSR